MSQKCQNYLMVPLRKSYLFLINNDYKKTALNHKRYAANVLNILKALSKISRDNSLVLCRNAYS